MLGFAKKNPKRVAKYFSPWTWESHPRPEHGPRDIGKSTKNNIVCNLVEPLRTQSCVSSAILTLFFWIFFLWHSMQVKSHLVLLVKSCEFIRFQLTTTLPMAWMRSPGFPITWWLWSDGRYLYSPVSHTSHHTVRGTQSIPSSRSQWQLILYSDHLKFYFWHLSFVALHSAEDTGFHPSHYVKLSELW